MYLTTIGGLIGSVNTNKLYSLIGEGSGRRWIEEFSPMPTKRYCVSALCTRTTLIVVGGDGHGRKDKALKAGSGCLLRTLHVQYHIYTCKVVQGFNLANSIYFIKLKPCKRTHTFTLPNFANTSRKP